MKPTAFLSERGIDFGGLPGPVVLRLRAKTIDRGEEIGLRLAEADYKWHVFTSCSRGHGLEYSPEKIPDGSMVPHRLGRGLALIEPFFDQLTNEGVEEMVNPYWENATHELSVQAQDLSMSYHLHGPIWDGGMYAFWMSRDFFPKLNNPKCYFFKR